MKYLKLFEALKYDNIELSQDEVDELYDGNDDSRFLCFTDKEVNDIRNFFAIKGIGIEIFGSKPRTAPNDVDRIVASKRRYGLYFNIEKLEDEWYLVYKNDSKNNSKYYKCDQLEGLKEVISKYIGSMPDNTKFSNELLIKVRRDKLLKQIDTKIKEMTNDQLEELLKKI